MENLTLIEKMTLVAIFSTQLVVLATAVLTAMAAWAASRRSHAAIKAAESLEHKVNGQLTAFKKLIRSDARAKGVLEGKAAQKRRDAAAPGKTGKAKP